MRKILPTKFGATPAERRSWYAPSVAWVLMATLGLQVGLYLSQLNGGWGKGVAVLIAVEGTAGLLLCVVACRVFIKSQFGLRTLLLTVVVVAVPCGWMGRELERARHQRELVERVSRYNYLDGGQRLVPKWLRKSLGEDFFAELEGVVLEDSETHASLTHLRGLTNLRSLYLMGTPVTDDGLAHLRGLKNLRFLDLTGTKITDAGLSHLRGLTNLQSLDLTGTKITDAGLAHLRELTNLSLLKLTGTKITDAGLAHISELTNLRSLYLYGTPVTGVGLAHLRELTNLQTLGLNGTQVTDDGLVHLQGLKNLQFLYLSGTQVTDERVRQLQADLPECQMDR